MPADNNALFPECWHISHTKKCSVAWEAAMGVTRGCWSPGQLWADPRASYSGQYIASPAIWSSWGRYASLRECAMPSNSVLDMFTKTFPLLDKGSCSWRHWMLEHGPFSLHRWPSYLLSLWYMSICATLPTSQEFDLPVPETGHSSCGGSPNVHAMPTIEERVET